MTDDKQRQPEGPAAQTVARQKVDDRVKAAAETAGNKPPDEARHEVEGGPVRRPEDVSPVDDEARKASDQADDPAARKAVTPNQPD